MIAFGWLSAHIPGDYRYSDSLTVALQDEGPDRGSVFVQVEATGAAGGMDTFNGPTDPRVDFRQDVGPGATAAQVLAAVRRAMVARSHFLFAKYGKPTKNFRWGHSGKGLNLAVVGAALAAARAELAVRPEAPVCDSCGKKIPARDVRAFQSEAGDDSLPGCCEDCAEAAVADHRIGGRS